MRKEYLLVLKLLNLKVCEYHAVIQVSWQEIKRYAYLQEQTRMQRRSFMEYQLKMPPIHVKDVIIEEIHGGVEPTYNEDGEIPVVRIVHLRNGEVLISSEELVTKEFYTKKSRAQVNKGDISLASTGKLFIVKIDLVENNIDYFADGHASIIRMDKEKYNKNFFVF